MSSSFPSATPVDAPGVDDAAPAPRQRVNGGVQPRDDDRLMKTVDTRFAYDPDYTDSEPIASTSGSSSSSSDDSQQNDDASSTSTTESDLNREFASERQREVEEASWMDAATVSDRASTSIELDVQANAPVHVHPASMSFLAQRSLPPHFYREREAGNMPMDIVSVAASRPLTPPRAASVGLLSGVLRMLRSASCRLKRVGGVILEECTKVL
ncbi:hypothetical protein NMY22_g19654 [Coprinellus aureogranulatus]|nr:hypothetical protein NMY22_g19654 [Coprinellus aureogranulatus]